MCSRRVAVVESDKATKYAMPDDAFPWTDKFRGDERRTQNGRAVIASNWDIRR